MNNFNIMKINIFFIYEEGYIEIKKFKEYIFK